VAGQVSWRDRFPEDVTCVRCLEVKSVQELDRLLWCEDCQAQARRRATIRGWMAGAALSLVLAAYIWFGIQPDLSLIPEFWIATLVVALYLGSRVAREFFYGYDRFRNRRAAEARPPAPDRTDPDNSGTERQDPETHRDEEGPSFR
jgi:hypothetical protein